MMFGPRGLLDEGQYPSILFIDFGVGVILGVILVIVAMKVGLVKKQPIKWGFTLGGIFLGLALIALGIWTK